ncbi:DUF4232 domain-containing protein [Streptomyces sp. NBC_00316]|uniref:DUF4232 domain-containing protein n=1 Tax=Streptomyces sp. NBC_00316 TaxID=2975710 RepID=UPI002E288149|nr:DUF4232 domain-containing protein [Streptomyces sp. NBC_00316]
MRLRLAPTSAFTVPAAAATAVMLTATGASATVGTAHASSAVRPGTCQEKALGVTASPGELQNEVRIRVTNQGDRSCVLDRTPTITFAGLDGSAQTVPPARSDRYTLARGERAYAAFRTADPASREGHFVGSVSVSADPSHYGVTFTAASVGMPQGIHVWEPVTTLWLGSAAAADSALVASLG